MIYSFGIDSRVIFGPPVTTESRGMFESGFGYFEVFLKNWAWQLFWNETGILTLKSIFSSFEYSYYGKNGDFLPIYGYFGGHFERCPISRIPRILNICQMLLLLTVYCIQIWFHTSKIIFSSFSCSNYSQNGNFSPIYGYFGGHFERRPILRIF